ncbi:unnamed protein product [Natator depressus]
MLSLRGDAMLMTRKDYVIYVLNPEQAQGEAAVSRSLSPFMPSQLAKSPLYSASEENNSPDPCAVKGAICSSSAGVKPGNACEPLERWVSFGWAWGESPSQI